MNSCKPRTSMLLSFESETYNAPDLTKIKHKPFDVFSFSSSLHPHLCFSDLRKQMTDKWRGICGCFMRWSVKYRTKDTEDMLRKTRFILLRGTGGRDRYTKGHIGKMPGG